MSEPVHQDDWLTIFSGDVREVLPTLPSDSVDCIVTSPPYWGLRDYGTANWDGGDAACDHMVDRFATPASEKQRSNSASGSKQANHVCPKCGAIRQDSQIGLERTPEEYVANMVVVFRELRRILKPSGTCWLNLGDSYSNPDKGGYAKSRVTATDSLQASHLANNFIGAANRQPQSGLKPKDLVGIPWRVAFALQADGWYLRSDIIWAKSNPMPESVTDRPTKAHEYLFLLTKSARYYYDADAVREAAHYPDAKGIPFGGVKHVGNNGNPTYSGNLYEPNGGRNLRSVWTIATRPYPGAHFAVFPPELPERCIKAGSSERGVCPECGAPWQRASEKEAHSLPVEERKGRRSHAGAPPQQSGWFWKPADIKGTWWEPTCKHTADPIPSVVLDPFAGSGTTGLVAQQLSRRAILIDLNPEYLKQQMERNVEMPLGLTA